MNDNLIEEIYKPLRVTIKGNVKILDTMTGTYVVKNKVKDVKGIYNYLRSRSFTAFPKIVDGNRNDFDVFEYVESVEMPVEQKAQDMVSVIASLHNKTSFFKEVTQDKYKEIYDTIKGNVLYMKNNYELLFNQVLLYEFMSPSQYLFARNYSTIYNSLLFCESELDKWYEIVKKKTRQRVALIHNNLELDHYIRGNEDYLISWDNSTVDTPVWDIVKFYRSSYYELEFGEILNKYFNEYEYGEDEKLLLFVLIVLPDKLEFLENEYHSTNGVRKILDYIFKTELLIRPYYTKEEEK